MHTLHKQNNALRIKQICLLTGELAELGPQGGQDQKVAFNKKFQKFWSPLHLLQFGAPLFQVATQN